MFDTLKIIDLNPSVPEDQIYDLLCEKFSNFSSVNVNIVQQDKGRVAYIYFKNSDDANVALKENNCIALFGYACRAVPVYNKPRSKRSTVSDDYFEAVDEHPSDVFRKSEEDRASLSPDEHDLKDRPPRQSSGYYRRGFHGARWLNRGAHWHRGSFTSRARGRGNRPYQFASRSGQKPYFLTKPRDDDERKPHSPLAARDSDGQKSYPLSPVPASDTVTETAEKEPNATLYIGSMDASVKVIDLQRLFNNFGYVLDVEIKNPSQTTCFAFVHFLTPDMAHLAVQKMEGKPIGRTVPKLGHGRTVESKCLWVGGLGPWTSEDMLRLEFGQFGEIDKVEWPRNRDYAFVLFVSVQDAADAKQVMHGCHHGDPPHRIRVCYATSVQMNSEWNYKHEFPKFPKHRIIPRSPKTRLPEKQKPRNFEFQESRHRRRRSSERSRSRSHPRKSRSHVRPRMKERSPPYARSISQASASKDMSSISETSSESIGSPERKRQRKRHRKLSVSRSPVNKLSRNPSPPKAVQKDERTVVLRSEPQPVAAASAGATSGVFTSVLNPLRRSTVPSYVSSVDPVMYYPSVASTLPPTMYPPPVHIPPPDFYMPANPVMPQFPQHLPPLASYPPVANDNTKPVPVASQSSIPNIPPVQTNVYMPSSVDDKFHQKTTPVKETQKPPSVSVAAKFPKVWSGALVLRNAAFVVDFHLLSGSVLLVNSLLGSNVEPGSEADCPVLKISQRLRLDQPDKLDELDRRLKKAGRTGCSILLATSAPAQVDDDANVVQQHPLSSLVSYLLQKQVAAVVSLPPVSSDAAKTTGVLHAFPPCPFATEFLHREAPGLPTNCPTEEELLVVLCEF